MKKVFLLFSVLVVLIVLLGTDIRRKKEAVSVSVEKMPCYGYTIVEFGKGVDCNGDTVKLIKVPGGGQQLARVE